MVNEGEVVYRLLERRFVAVQDAFEFSVEAYTDALPTHVFRIRSAVHLRIVSIRRVVKGY